MAGQKSTMREDYEWLTLLSINTALRESYRKLSLSVRVPYKLLKADDLEFTGLFGFISRTIKEKKNSRYLGDGMLILPEPGGLGKVVLCDEILGEHFGLPTHHFASRATLRSLLARYIAALLLGGALGFSGFCGDRRKKSKTALGIMHASSQEHYHHFSHSKLAGSLKRTLSVKCERISSDFRELGVTDTDLLYALEREPNTAEEKAFVLQNEISELETLAWLIERKKSGQLSGKTALQLSIHASFLKKTLAALAKMRRRRACWDADKAFEPGSLPYHKALESLAACESIPAKNLIPVLEGLQPYKKRILMAVI